MNSFTLASAVTAAFIVGIVCMLVAITLAKKVIARRETAMLRRGFEHGFKRMSQAEIDRHSTTA